MARPRRRVGNVPAETTTFVGRRRELAELRKALSTARLASLVGPGGVGKTRLAARVATDLARGFADGAWWIELAEVADDALVPDAVLAALDVPDRANVKPIQLLLSHVRERELLLVLDNCEHVLDAAAQVAAEMLQAARGVRVVVTSREPLQVPGEHVVPVPPLQLPAATPGQSLADLRHNEAVALFADRAAAASGTFILDSANQEAVVALCRRLDGLPLAIELAAVRTRVLSADQILGRLTDRFALLTGGGRAALPRQQTLRTTIDWSHDLLTADEQKLLRRVGVFAGLFIVDDVEGVCALDGPAGEWVLDCLAALVDKSLVAKEDVAGRAAYRLHETMREYANERLKDAGEVEVLDDAYIDYYRARFRDLRADLLHDISAILHSGVTAGHRTLDWLEMVDLEIDNIRSALQKCVDRGDWRRGLELATSIGYYWITRGTTEGMRWLDDLLTAAGGSAAVPARAYYFRGWLTIVTGDVTAARSCLDRAIATARAADEMAPLAEALSAASVAAGLAGDADAARSLLHEAGAIAPQLDHYPAVIAALHARAALALIEGDLNDVEATAAEGARVSQEIGDLYYHETMLMDLGFVALVRGNLARSRSHFSEALRISAAIDNRLGQSTLLRGLAANAAAAGDARLAARLFGAADALVSPHTSGATPFAVEFDRARASAKASLGASKFDSEYSAGQKHNRDTALQLALGQRETHATDAATESDYGVLAKREAEVAELIAEGLTNKQIGGRLFISERTVATHVRNILNKLGFDSRAQIASWVSSPRS